MLNHLAHRFWALLLVVGIAQAPMPYQNRNQIDYDPLVVRVIAGTVSDSHGSIPNARIGLFSEPGHQLVTEIRADDNGTFRTDAPSGEYRLVVAVDGLCPANAKIRVAAWPRGGLFRSRQLRVRLTVGSIDSCSWIEYR